MEFQGQRGDPLSAWSVGKYAKRSATIHLNSKDQMRKGASHFRANIVTQDVEGIVFDDPGGVVRAQLSGTLLSQLSPHFCRAAIIESLDRGAGEMGNGTGVMPARGEWPRDSESASHRACPGAAGGPPRLACCPTRPVSRVPCPVCRVLSNVPAATCNVLCGNVQHISHHVSRNAPRIQPSSHCVAERYIRSRWSSMDSSPCT